MRAFRALWRVPAAVTVAAALSGVVLAVRKVAPDAMSEAVALYALCGAALSVLVAGLVSWWRALPPHAGALALDRHHLLAGRLSNAVAFAVGDADASSEALDAQWRRAAIEDAYRHIDKLEPRAAVPLRWPPELAVSGAVVLSVMLLASFEVRAIEPLRAGAHLAQHDIDPLELSEDDLDALRASLGELAKHDPSPEVKRAIQRFNQLVEDLAHRRIDRSEAFRRMSRLEEELLRGARADRKATEAALRDTAKELENSELARPVADALKKGDLDTAEKRMRALAERLRSKAATKPDKKQLERLRRALDRASSQRKQALAQIDKKRAEMRRQLLVKKREAKAKKYNKIGRAHV
jgi:hypothetical protein